MTTATTDEPAWWITDHVRGLIAEILVAEYCYRTTSAPGETHLMRPRFRGYDVESPDLAGKTRTVDAKVADLAPGSINGGQRTDLIGWRAGDRHIDESVTHIGLVELDEETVLRCVDKNGRLSFDGQLSGLLWLVPRATAEQALPLWSKRSDQPGKGAYRYLSRRDVEQYFVGAVGRDEGPALAS